VGATLA